MVEDSVTYYRRRCTEELGAADRATDPVAAEIHRSLAARYSALAGQPQVRAVKLDPAREFEGSQDRRTFG